MNQTNRIFRWLTTQRVMLAAFLLIVFSGCGGKPSPEQAIVGRWDMDKEATAKTNPFMAAAPGGS